MIVSVCFSSVFLFWCWFYNVSYVKIITFCLIFWIKAPRLVRRLVFVFTGVSQNSTCPNVTNCSGWLAASFSATIGSWGSKEDLVARGCTFWAPLWSLTGAWSSAEVGNMACVQHLKLSANFLFVGCFAWRLTVLGFTV